MINGRYSSYCIERAALQCHACLIEGNDQITEGDLINIFSAEDGSAPAAGDVASKRIRGRTNLKGSRNFTAQADGRRREASACEKEDTDLAAGLLDKPQKHSLDPHRPNSEVPAEETVLPSLRKRGRPAKAKQKPRHGKLGATAVPAGLWREGRKVSTSAESWQRQYVSRSMPKPGSLIQGNVTLDSGELAVPQADAATSTGGLREDDRNKPARKLAKKRGRPKKRGASRAAANAAPLRAPDNRSIRAAKRAFQVNQR